jgi:hypothetical protein
MPRQNQPDESPTLGYLATMVKGVWLKCESCDRTATMPIDELILKFGEATQFGKIRERFKCTACGSRNVYARPDWPPVRSMHNPGI